MRSFILLSPQKNYRYTSRVEIQQQPVQIKQQYNINHEMEKKLFIFNCIFERNYLISHKFICAFYLWYLMRIASYLTLSSGFNVSITVFAAFLMISETKEQNHSNVISVINSRCHNNLYFSHVYQTEDHAMQWQILISILSMCYQLYSCICL